MQTTIIPVRNLKTGNNSHLSGYLSNKGVEYKRHALTNLGKVLAERLMYRGVSPDDKMTIATTQHDLDNLTKGFISALNPTDYALNIMFTQSSSGRPRIEVMRYENCGSRDILVIPIHALNEVFTIKDMILSANTHAKFSKIYVLTPVIVQRANSMLDLIMKRQGRDIELIAIHIDREGRYKRFLESEPVYDDRKNTDNKYLLQMLRRTVY